MLANATTYHQAVITANASTIASTVKSAIVSGACACMVYACLRDVKDDEIQSEGKVVGEKRCCRGMRHLIVGKQRMKQSKLFSRF